MATTPKKGPSTIKWTPLKGWKTTETTRPPMNQRLRTQFFFFFGVFDADLPTFVFLRGALLFFAMVAMNVGVVIFIQSGG
jgi:hypothetical protein